MPLLLQLVGRTEIVNGKFRWGTYDVQRGKFKALSTGAAMSATNAEELIMCRRYCALTP
jgi:hypothetical protein